MGCLVCFDGFVDSKGNNASYTHISALLTYIRAYVDTYIYIFILLFYKTYQFEEVVISCLLIIVVLELLGGCLGAHYLMCVLERNWIIVNFLIEIYSILINCCSTQYKKTQPLLVGDRICLGFILKRIDASDKS